MTTTEEVTPARAAARIIASGLKIGLNLGKHVPCEDRNDPDCKRAASWRWRHCCAQRNLCQYHHVKQILRLEVMGYYLSATGWTCTDCGTHPMPNPTHHPI